MYDKKIFNIIKNLLDTYLFTQREIENITGVSKATVSRWKNIIWVENKEKNSFDISKIIEHIEYLLKIDMFSTINDIQKYLKAQNINCSYELIRCLMKKHLKMSYKKCKYANFTNEEKLKEQTITHHLLMTKLYNENIDRNTLFIASIDEVGFCSRSMPLYGWFKKGEKVCIPNKLKKDRKNKSVCACITTDGRVYYDIKDTPFTTDFFLQFLKTLNLPKHAIVLVDNVNFHKSNVIKEYALEKNWNLIYIPPYSPRFNPIENIFGSVKTHFRRNKSIKDAFKIKATRKAIINSFNFMLERTLKRENIFKH